MTEDLYGDRRFSLHTTSRVTSPSPLLGCSGTRALIRNGNMMIISRRQWKQAMVPYVKGETERYRAKSEEAHGVRSDLTQAHDP